MGTNRLINGDCISAMGKISDNSVDLIFADPPYNLQLDKNKILYRKDGSKIVSVKDEWDSFKTFEDYDNFSEAWIKECKRILKPTGSFWVIGSYHNIFRVGAIMQDLGFWLLNDIIWNKTQLFCELFRQNLVFALQNQIRTINCFFAYSLVCYTNYFNTK